jgi:hypothetical protein
MPNGDNAALTLDVVSAAEDEPLAADQHARVPGARRRHVAADGGAQPLQRVEVQQPAVVEAVGDGAAWGTVGCWIRLGSVGFGWGGWIQVVVM